MTVDDLRHAPPGRGARRHTYGALARPGVWARLLAAVNPTKELPMVVSDAHLQRRSGLAAGLSALAALLVAIAVTAAVESYADAA